MRRLWKYGTAGALSLTLVIGLCATDFTKNISAATEHWNDASQESASWTKWKNNWTALSSNYEHVSLTPGQDETQLNYAWYSHTNETPKVRISLYMNMSGAKEFQGTQTKITLEGLTNYYSNKVTVAGLKASKTYYYQVYQNGAWQTKQSYTTKSFSNFSFLYVGDPQIGACKGQTSTENTSMSESDANLAARNDAYNWNQVLNGVVKRHKNVSFMVSAGDQVNTAENEEEYAGYLGADALSSLPVSTTIGNHDSKSTQYSLHYNNPNSFSDSDSKYTEGKTVAGTDYYYTYGGVLFIVLDTNNYNCATHENVIKKAVSENKDANWRVVTFHQDIYGSGYDHSDSDGIVLRTQLTPIMDKYDIDVVLQGHDHTYSRTYQLTSDGKSHTSYDKSNYSEDTDYLKQNNCYNIESSQESGTITNPEGTVYMEANSATGSKFYNLIPTQQDYISERSQTWTPSYSVVDVTKDTFTITTYDATTGAELEGSSSYTIKKTSNEKPQTPAITVTSSKTKQVKVSWKKNTQVTGVQIAVSTDKNMTKGVKTYDVKSNKVTSKTITTQASGKKYYVKARTYKVVDGKRVYSSYGSVKTVTVK